ncbi:glycoside hydrolase family 16 protein [Xylariales sp. PMI_506]|nr:glycoside hydrolase family 16 protein [Xylariales sp. PMI_506]
MYAKNPLLAAAASVSVLPQLVAAIMPPDYSAYGYTLEWYSEFLGDAGAAPASGNWNVISGYLDVNDELEVYTSSSSNVQVSGGETLQLVPWDNDGWTSGRIESVYTFTPGSGYTCVEAEIRFGESTQAQKQGIWPAFWLLGESCRTGSVGWPACGELDIMEMVDGILTGYGTAHCDVYPGGLCDESTGLRGTVAVPDYEWHTWRLIFNNNPTNWEEQTITWYLDGVEFWQITGATFASDEAVWNSLAHNSMYIILNVAVGGDWPGSPSSATLAGYDNMMEVNYVAQYSGA